MSKIIMIAWIVGLPQLAFAGSDCRVIEFPDHYEAICTGLPPPSAAVHGAASGLRPGQEQAANQELPPGLELPTAQVQSFEELQAVQEQREADGGGKIALSGLGILHGAQWLRTLRHR
jgi:hypothetical protein